MNLDFCTSKMILKEEHVYFGGMSLSYRFLARSRRGVCSYAVGVRLGREYCEAELGGEPDSSYGHYQKIVRGCVTPCTLEEVVRDLCDYV